MTENVLDRLAKFVWMKFISVRFTITFFSWTNYSQLTSNRTNSTQCSKENKKMLIKNPFKWKIFIKMNFAFRTLQLLFGFSRRNLCSGQTWRTRKKQERNVKKNRLNESHFVGPSHCLHVWCRMHWFFVACFFEFDSLFLIFFASLTFHPFVIFHVRSFSHLNRSSEHWHFGAVCFCMANEWIRSLEN